MKFLKTFLFLIISSLLVVNNVWAVSWQGTPESIMNSVEGSARPGRDTRLDTVGNTGVHGIQPTLESLQYKITYYIKWAVYIGLSLAVIFLIYNGLLMTLTPLTHEGYAKIRKRVTYLAVGIVMLTGFTIVLRIVLSIIANITG